MVKIINGKDLVGTINGISIISGNYPPRKTGKVRTCIPIEKVTSTTVHNTGNASKGAGARNHHQYLHNVENSGERYVGYHFVVDDRHIIQCLPLDEATYHCGEKGNYNSISIEICENVDMDYKKAEENAVALIKELLRLYNISDIKSHRDWSGKNCPHIILPYWDDFVKRCKEGSDTKPKKLYRVQVGAFAIKDNALRLQQELKEKGYDAIIKEN